ncbi:MAG: RagB/SusD family nutrient uptake outer membrane protein [Saprospiraceae bacterium]|nr:RagB/SusD family nutrient uptake outer membrane protein [Saprospiraceae bacterium]
MKKIANIYLVAVVLLLASCSQEFIELAPVSSRSVEGFYKSEEQLQQALAGVYDGLQQSQTGAAVMLLKEERSDNTFQQTLLYNYLTIVHFTESSDNIRLYPVWSTLYEAIYRCNIFLQKIQPVEFMEASEKAAMIGEAKTIRALLYFDLVRYFGGVPVVTTPLTISESLTIGRASIEEVYQLIVEDLDDAVASLPNQYDGSNTGRITVFAAKALLGKVYVTRSGYPLNLDEWGKARDLFEDVISSGQFEFFENYDDIFDIINDNGKQSVFYVQFNAGALGEGNPMPRIHAPGNIDRNNPELGVISGGSSDSPFISDDLIMKFEEGDVRLSKTIQFEWLQNDGTMQTRPFCKKFGSGGIGPQNNWDINWPVIRYTEVLMLYAEALNELGYQTDGMAFQILNDVRRRAGLEVKTAADIPDQQSFRDWILDERRFEFAFENLRWFDLVRTDRGYDVMHEFLSPYHLEGNVTREKYLFPIPSRVIQTNPLITQNPGF